MYSVSCRDSGLDCDWFFRGEDKIDVMVNDLRHTATTHAKEFKMMTDGKEIWEIVLVESQGVKDDGQHGN
jgi:predicted small metal-binding protein